MTTILAFDTTHGCCSVATAKDGHILSSVRIDEQSKQAEQLLPSIEQALADAKLNYTSIDALAVTTGPGSFTGVRIGLATARGILLSTTLPCVGVSCMEAVAYSAKNQEKNNLCIILDARRGEVYIQLFSADLSPLTEAALCTYEEAATQVDASALLAGNGTHLVAPLLSKAPKIAKADMLPQADSIALLAIEKLKKNDTGLDITPLYIRKPDAKVSQKKI